jgi:hypothetical protein
MSPQVSYRLGHLASSIGRIGVDDQELVEQREALHQLVAGPADDDADRLFFVQGRQHQADGQTLLALELHQPTQIAELAVVEVRFAEPALDPHRHRSRVLGRPLGRGQRFAPGRDGFRQRAEQVCLAAVGRG